MVKAMDVHSDDMGIDKVADDMGIDKVANDMGIDKVAGQKLMKCSRKSLTCQNGQIYVDKRISLRFQSCGLFVSKMEFHYQNEQNFCLRIKN